MSTYKVMIADDERNIVEGLCRLIDWEGEGCHIVATASNGMQALEQMQEFDPDIVISDIRMPLMSGLEMIEKASEVSHARFIIISGYSDFEYARKCLNLNVFSYLLKPVDEDELLQNLRSLQQVVDADRRSSSAQELAFREFMEWMPVDEVEALSMMADLKLDLPKLPCYILAFCFGEDGSRRALITTLKECGSNVVFQVARDRYIALIPLQQDRKKLLPEDLQNYSEAYPHFNIVTGEEVPRYCDIPAAAYQCLYSLDMTKDMQLAMLNEDDVHCEGDFLSPPQLMSFKEALFTGDKELIYLTAEQILKQSGKHALIALRFNAMSLIMLAIQHLEVFREADTDFIARNFSNLRTIYSINSTEQILQFVRDFLVQILAQNTDALQPKRKSIIAMICDYINDNIQTDLSLVATAQKFHISANYLSQLFKKETGELFSNYVANIKMEHAKLMLHDKNMRIYEIAQALGYKDTRYFSRLFEKYSGDKPTDYRKKLNRKEA